MATCPLWLMNRVIRKLLLSRTGIDIQGLPYVINLTLPDVVENYIHRVGRVGRADCIGLAISVVAAPSIDEKVWYHTCANRGKGCTNRTLKDKGGCTIWYGEPDILRQVCMFSGRKGMTGNGALSHI